MNLRHWARGLVSSLQACSGPRVLDLHAAILSCSLANKYRLDCGDGAIVIKLDQQLLRITIQSDRLDALSNLILLSLQSGADRNTVVLEPGRSTEVGA